MTDEQRADLLIEQMNQHRAEHGLLVNGTKKGVFVLADELVRVRTELLAARNEITHLIRELHEAQMPWYVRLWRKFR